MRKILLKDAYPDLAAQLVDESLVDTLCVGSPEKVRWCCEHGHEWDAIVSNRTKKGRGCPYCSGRLAIPGETDLATLRPDIAAQLVDSSLASTLKVTSHKKVEWRCEHGHVWEATVAIRTSKNSGCPYCSGRLAVPGETDFVTLYPELAAELVDAELARTLRPGSNRKVEWVCAEGHRWFAAPNTRVQTGSGCPYCGHKRVKTGVNDLASQRPDLVVQLADPSLASELFVYSNRRVTWRCEKGHEWDALVSNRVQFEYGCPICAAGKHASKGEDELADFISSLVGETEVTRNDRDILDGREVDVLLKRYGVGFEFNGVYWHSDAACGSRVVAHTGKVRDCAQKGIRLFNVWEDDWINRREAVCLMIQTMLGLLGNAPSEIVFTVDANAAKQFLEVHSLTGSSDCDVYVFAEGCAFGGSIIDDSVRIQTYASLWSRDSVIDEACDALCHALGMTSDTPVWLETDSSYDDGFDLAQTGFAYVSEKPAKTLLVGGSTKWQRVCEDDVSTEIAAKCYKTSDCGSKLWVRR